MVGDAGLVYGIAVSIANATKAAILPSLTDLTVVVVLLTVILLTCLDA